MDKEKLLGRGMTAEAYEWEKGKVLKLFYESFSSDAIDYEKKVGDILNNLDVRAPFTYDLIEVEGRKGIIYERINGKSVLAYMQKNPLKIVHYAKKMAQLHYKIHKEATDKLPVEKERIKYAINDARNILGERFITLNEKLEKLDIRNSVCHGDFHPDNILLEGEKYMAIDWMNAYAGNPLSDVARSYLMFSTPFNPPGMSKLTIKLSGIIKKIMKKAYIKEYVKISGCKQEDIMGWVPLVAAARLREKIPGEEQWLLQLIDERL